MPCWAFVNTLSSFQQTRHVVGCRCHTLSACGAAGMSPDEPSGWTLYAQDQKQRAEVAHAQRNFLRQNSTQASAAAAAARRAAAKQAEGEAGAHVATAQSAHAAHAPQQQQAAQGGAAQAAQSNTSAMSSDTGALVVLPACSHGWLPNTSRVRKVSHLQPKCSCNSKPAQAPA